MSRVEQAGVERAVRALLRAIGEDVDREGLQDTPARVARMWSEFIDHPPGQIDTAFQMVEADQMVVVSGLRVWSICEHHLLPFWCEVAIGYVTQSQVLGLSKFARIAQKHAHGLQIQERLVQQIAEDVGRLAASPDVAVLAQGEHLCYDRETEVLTPGGWIAFPDLSEDEMVAQVDPATLAMDFVVPTAHVRYHHAGNMLRFRSQVVDLCVTPDHRVLCLADGTAPDRTTPWQFTRAKDLPARFYVPQACDWQATDWQTVDVGGLTISADDYVRFMGVWLAEGCTRAGKRDTVISQNTGPFEEEIWTLLQRLPFNFRRVVQANRPDHVQFKSSNPYLYEHLRHFGKSGDKHIPYAIKQMSKRQIELFIDWYARGDGSTTKRNPLRCIFVSKSHLLIDDLQELLIRVGRTGSVCRYGGYYRLTTRAHKRDEGGPKWYGKISPPHRSEVPYDDTVYCVTVPTGAILVRRNGCPVVSGNCMTMRGVRTPGIMTSSVMRGVFREQAQARAEFLALVRQASEVRR
jgi:GTP cyclohydrolase I